MRHAVMALVVLAMAPACLYTAPDEPAPVVEYVASEPCPVAGPAPVPHTLDGTPAPVVEPAGVYCTPAITWEFGPGYVVRLDDQITILWQWACAVEETGVPALCTLPETWPITVELDRITVGGITAVGEWAGGCDP